MVKVFSSGKITCIKRIPSIDTSQITVSPLLDFILWLKPRGLNYLLEKSMPHEIRQYYDFLDVSVKERIDLEHEVGSSDRDIKSRKDIFHYLYHVKDPETGKPAFPGDELLAEAHLLIRAGSDTTAASLCGLFFYLTHYPRVYSKLVSEIRSTFQSVEDIVEGSLLASCVYLRACIDEAMRMSPAAPSELSRTVLPGGMVVDGDFIPEGTMVGTAAWTDGRNEQSFSDASTYCPERWIVNEESGNSAEDVARLRASFHPFSAGPGNCVGRNLAWLEMFLVVSRTLYRMDVRQAPGITLGEGSPELGWGREDKNQFQLLDAFVAIRQGPVLQFRRTGSQ